MASRLLLRINNSALSIGSCIAAKYCRPSLASRATPVRSLVTYINEDDDYEFELEEFIIKSKHMGGSKFPGFKKVFFSSFMKEYYLNPLYLQRALKDCKRRQMMINKRQGKISNNKVRALVDFVEFKNAFDYQ